MSDSIVLWRMCVVWERARPALAFAAVLLITILGLNVTNIVVLERSFVDFPVSSAITFNPLDLENTPTYGATSIGIAAAFVSLASNVCATALVASKAWYDLVTHGNSSLYSGESIMLGYIGDSPAFIISERWYSASWSSLWTLEWFIPLYG